MFRCFKRQGSYEGEESLRKKLVIVGDGECGKTSLLHRFVKDEFKEDSYIPTVFEVDVTRVRHQDKEVELVLYDTAGQEDYDRLRPFSYPDTDIVLVCFSVNNPDSLENVSYNWAPEVRHFCGNVPVVLVGTKKDLRPEMFVTDTLKQKSQFTTIQQGEEMAYRIGAVAYLECSSKLNEGVAEVLHKAVTEVLKMKRRKNKLKDRDLSYRCAFLSTR